MKLLKFSAEWCSPCSEQKNRLEEYDATPVVEIDVDSDEGMDRANVYTVRSLPTMVLLDDNDQPVERWTGLTEVSEIEESVESYK